MPITEYSDLDEGDNLQINIMHFVSWWVHTQKTPIPRKAIMEQFHKRIIGKGTLEYNIDVLVKEGFIRKAYTISNKTTYVQLKTV